MTCLLHIGLCNHSVNPSNQRGRNNYAGDVGFDSIFTSFSLCERGNRNMARDRNADLLAIITSPDGVCIITL